MSEIIVDDYSSGTVKIEENVVIKKEFYDSDDSDMNIPLSDFITDKRGNVVEFYEGEHYFTKPEPIESGPSGSSNIDDSGSRVGRIKSHVCLECDKTFTSKANLKIHVDAVHRKLKNYLCGECDRAFAQHVHLKVHVDGVHRKLKKYSCGECDRAFTLQHHLKVRVDAVHKKLKKYSCGECDRAFAGQGDLTKHVNAVHKKLEKSSYGEFDCAFESKCKLNLYVKRSSQEVE